jgi:hypothetical protein
VSVTAGMGSWQDGRWIGGGWPHSSPAPDVPPLVVPSVHGTANEYRRGCRCDPCREAKAVQQREYVARKRAAA